MIRGGTVVGPEGKKDPGPQAKQTRVAAYFKSNLPFEAIAQKIHTIASL
jgi:hypothetical protein